MGPVITVADQNTVVEFHRQPRTTCIKPYSQNLENGCLKLTVVKFLGHPILRRRQQYTEVISGIMSLYNVKEMTFRWKTFKCMLEIDSLLGFACPKDTQIPCWLRLMPSTGILSRIRAYLKIMNQLC